VTYGLAIFSTPTIRPQMVDGFRRPVCRTWEYGKHRRPSSCC
jgi:hypothetical protein